MKKVREVAIVMDADKNEIYFGETYGECEEYCKAHNITGSNGEYIATGNFDEEYSYFEIEDYYEIGAGYAF